MSYVANVVQIQETGEEMIVRTVTHGDPDIAEDRACAYINNNDLDSQYPESRFVVRVHRASDQLDADLEEYDDDEC